MRTSLLKFQKIENRQNSKIAQSPAHRVDLADKFRWRYRELVTRNFTPIMPAQSFGHVSSSCGSPTSSTAGGIPRATTPKASSSVGTTGCCTRSARVPLFGDPLDFGRLASCASSRPDQVLDFLLQGSCNSRRINPQPQFAEKPRTKKTKTDFLIPSSECREEVQEAAVG